MATDQSDQLPLSAYEEEPDGFRYRFLGVNSNAPYQTVIRQLLPGEQLYRRSRYALASGSLPYLYVSLPIRDEADFRQAQIESRTGGATFELLAGLPKTYSPQRVPDGAVPSIMPIRSRKRRALVLR